MSGQLPISTVKMYDPVTDAWTRKAGMPTPRRNFAMPVVNGKIYAIGGLILDGPVLATVEAYDPVTDTWERKADMPTIIHKHATSVVNGKIYVIGGSNGIDTGCKAKNNRIMNIQYRIKENNLQ